MVSLDHSNAHERCEYANYVSRPATLTGGPVGGCVSHLRWIRPWTFFEADTWRQDTNTGNSRA